MSGERKVDDILVGIQIIGRGSLSSLPGILLFMQEIFIFWLPS